MGLMLQGLPMGKALTCIKLIFLYRIAGALIHDDFSINPCGSSYFMHEPKT